MAHERAGVSFFLFLLVELPTIVRWSTKVDVVEIGRQLGSCFLLFSRHPRSLARCRTAWKLLRLLLLPELLLVVQNSGRQTWTNMQFLCTPLHPDHGPGPAQSRPTAHGSHWAAARSRSLSRQPAPLFVTLCCPGDFGRSPAVPCSLLLREDISCAPPWRRPSGTFLTSRALVVLFWAPWWSKQPWSVALGGDGSKAPHAGQPALDLCLIPCSALTLVCPSMLCLNALRLCVSAPHVGPWTVAAPLRWRHLCG